MRIAVTGADGQLGFELCRQLGGRGLALYESQLDITSHESVRRVIENLRPEALINTAAYTNVDGAESDEERCFAVNVAGTRHLAEACCSIDAYFVQISTDYIFDGGGDRGTPFREQDEANPHGVYARSKLLSESAARTCPRHLIVRTCGLYANRQDAAVRNFAKTMLRLAGELPVVRVVNDQHCTPSYVPHVVRAILFLLDECCHGTYHVVNSGATTWFGFARELFRQANVTTRLDPISSAEYPLAAKRPAYSVLDGEKYSRLGGPAMPSWQQGITDFLQATPTRC